MEPPDPALGAALAAPVVSDWGVRLAMPGVVQSEYKTLPMTLVGVNPEAEARLSSIPGKVIEGRYLSGPDDDGIVLGLHMAERLKTGLGRRVILMSQNAEGALSEQSFDVVGLFDADQGTEDFFGFVGLQTGQAFLRLDDEISQIVVRLVETAELDPAFAALRAAAPDLDVRTWKQLNIFLASSDAAMGVFIFVWLGVVFSLMAIGIVNTQLMAVFERTQEFGLLRALGMKPRLVLLMVTFESAVLIGAGVLLGAAAGGADDLEPERRYRPQRLFARGRNVSGRRCHLSEVPRRRVRQIPAGDLGLGRSGGALAGAPRVEMQPRRSHAADNLARKSTPWTRF